MKTFVYVVVQFIPDIASDERLNVGVIVGNNIDGFKATWRPERAKLFGFTIDEKLGAWIEKLKPMSVEMLVNNSNYRRDYLQMTPLRPMNLETLDEALALAEKEFLKTNEQLLARW